jgi:hypothetical protein
MTLKNLLATRQLHEHEADPVQVRRMFTSALTALEDAGLEDVSAETRFDVAYRAIMQCAMVALWANGFRPATNVAGQHALMIQALTKSIGPPPEKVRALDAFRSKRNAIDYQGKEMDEASAAGCRAPPPSACATRSGRGVWVEREFSGFAARVFLHEHDHLEGLTWLDRVEDNRDIVTEKEYLRLM